MYESSARGSCDRSTRVRLSAQQIALGAAQGAAERSGVAAWPGLRARCCLVRLLWLMPGLLVALVGVLGLAVASADASGIKTVTVGPGDAIAIHGSDIECVVSTTAPRAIVCAIGSKKALRLHSYAVTVADKGAAIFVATGSQQVVAREINPAITGAPIKGSGHKPTSYVLANGEGVLVAGTHVECGSVRIDDNTLQTIGCGIYNASSGRYYAAGTYAATVDDKYAGILRAGKNGAQTVVATEKQR
jgi:hypothetical protein